MRSAGADGSRGAARAAPGAVGLRGAGRRPPCRPRRRAPMIQLTRRGLVADDPAAVADLARTFERVNCVKIVQFLEPAILTWLAAAVDRARFVPRVHDIEPPATDLRLDDHDIRSTLLLVF